MTTLRAQAIQMRPARRDIALIGAASGWGAGARATEDGPPALRALGIDAALRARGVGAHWTAMVAPRSGYRDIADPGRAAIVDLVADHAARLADAVEAATVAGNLPVVLGGDHAVAIGTWGGLARQVRPLGLIWYDAHLDAHTAATTPSTNPHGMAAATLLGHGEPAFLRVGGAAIRPENLCYIGARSFESEERALLASLGVRVIDAAEMHERGLEAATREAFAIATDGTDGFGVTIDLDGFDPEDAPGTGLHVPGGFRAKEMVATISVLGRAPGFKALEVVEYLPAADDAGGRTAALVRDLVMAVGGVGE